MPRVHQRLRQDHAGHAECALRLNVPTVIVSGGPTEAGKTKLAGVSVKLDLFTANSMNCLAEALGLSLPGNGTTLATHADRRHLFLEPARPIVDISARYHERDDDMIDIDILNRSVNLAISDDEMTTRREAMDARGADGWQPAGRDRTVSAAQQAYAAMTTSADRGSLRDVSRLRH